MINNIKTSNFSKYAKQKAIDVSENSIKKTNQFSSFLKQIGDVALFIKDVFVNTFSKGFEFNEFLKQCFQIGNNNIYPIFCPLK
jgi:phospholipid/cholesterol/gamma-HCH transport system permease protein